MSTALVVAELSGSVAPGSPPQTLVAPGSGDCDSRLSRCRSARVAYGRSTPPPRRLTRVSLHRRARFSMLHLADCVRCDHVTVCAHTDLVAPHSADSQVTPSCTESATVYLEGRRLSFSVRIIVAARSLTSLSPAVAADCIGCDCSTASAQADSTLPTGTRVSTICSIPLAGPVCAARCRLAVSSRSIVASRPASSAILARGLLR